MKKIIFITLFFALCLVSNSCKGNTTGNNRNNTENVSDTHFNDNEVSRDAKVQVAILLDTSSSMDGLIEQAKSRLWNIVNTLTTLKYKGKTPHIEIALYEYGNNGISNDDYVRQVTPLTTDLDLISEKLFSLTTNGGLEYCGTVISRAVNSLEWGTRPSDMKLIYIAGNEPFTQGKISYKSSIGKALDKNIYVNTIHCGYLQEGIEGMWKDGAIKGKGKFFNIDHNVKVRHYDTPYDTKISACNERLNSTYIGYGAIGEAKKESQVVQDRNARSISSANYAERAVTKTKKAYNNSRWDLVDKVKEDKNALDKIEQSELPKELQNKSKEEVKEIVKQKEKERETLQKEIAQLAQKRQEYIDEQVKKEGENTGDDLGKAINESVLELASLMGYKVGQ